MAQYDGGDTDTKKRNKHVDTVSHATSSSFEVSKVNRYEELPSREAVYCPNCGQPMAWCPDRQNYRHIVDGTRAGRNCKHNSHNNITENEYEN